MGSKAVGFLTFNFGANMGGFNKAMKKAQRKVKNFGKSMKRVGSSMTTNLTMPIIGLGAVAIKTFADFEQAMLKVKAISGATAEEFKMLESDAKRLGSTTMFTASQVAELQLNLSKLGLTPEEINKSTESILSLAQATDSDLGQAATVAASTMKGFGMEATEIGRISDVMADSFSSTALDMDKFQTSMAIVAPVAKQAGAGLEETTAIIGALTNRGIDASSAGTALRNVYLELAKKGLTWNEAMEKIASSGTGMEQLAVATEMFGKKGALVSSVIANNRDEIQGLTKDFKDSAGEAGAMAAEMDSGAKGAMRRLASQAEGVAISLGEMLIPVFQKIMGLIQKGLSWWSNLDGEMKKNIITIGLIVGAIGPVISIVGTLATAFGMILSPVGLIVAALVAGGYLIYQNWEPIKKLIVDVTNYFIDLYNESMIFRIGIQAIIITFKNLWAQAKFTFNAMKGLVVVIINSWIDQFSAVAKVIKSALSFDLDGVKEGASEYGAAVVDGIKGTAKVIKEEAQIFGEEIAENVKEGMGNAMSREKIDFITEDDVQGAVDSAADVAMGIYDKIKGVFAVGSGGSGSAASGTSSTKKPTFKKTRTGSGGSGSMMGTSFATANKEIEKTKSLMDILNDTFGITELSLQQMGETLGQTLSRGADDFQEFGEQVKSAIKDIIGALIAEGVAAAVTKAMSNPALSINPLLIPVVAGLAAGAAKTAFSSLIPAFADGGIVSGPTVGLMGEYPGAGAGNPEVIAPLKKLQGMMNGGSQQVEVFGRLSGNDIWLSNSKTGGQRQRGI